MLSWEILKAYEDGMNIIYDNKKDNINICITKQDTLAGVDLARLYLQPQLWKVTKPAQRYWLWNVFNKGMWFKTTQYLNDYGIDTCDNMFTIYDDNQVPRLWDTLIKTKCASEYIDIKDL